jgi:hypothetical protein
MNFRRFVERCRSEWPEFDDQRALAVSRVPADRSLAPLLKEIPGMATENKLRLLNLAASALAEGEVYVEVGCYRGLSLCGAAQDNPAVPIFACDNFSQFDGTAAALQRMVDKHTPAGQVNLYDADFRELFHASPWEPRRIGVYFYDGGHSFRDQYEALVLAHRHLADDALVIIDDTNKPAVRAANALFARQAAGFEPVLDLRTPRNHSPTWWNGIQVFRFRRGERGRRPEFYGEGYQFRKLFYDDLVLNFRHRRRAMQQKVKRWLRGRSGNGSRYRASGD